MRGERIAAKGIRIRSPVRGEAAQAVNNAALYKGGC